MLHRIGPILSVPANASRFFDKQHQALGEIEASIGLAWDDQDPYLFNSLYDHTLVKYDEQYCTAVSGLGKDYVIPTFEYFQDLEKYLPKNFTVIDIGCGQGEFIEQLRVRGIQGVGYDPVLRNTNEYLHSEYWNIKEASADLYVMRCVLPHIQHPWTFLGDISQSAPGALVLVEFQRLEWIIENKLWYQLSHDHLNLFSVKDFLSRYTVHEHGTFSNGEWGWVLLDPTKFHVSEVTELEHQQGVIELFETRKRFLEQIANVNRPIAIWGAAGKGTILAHALNLASSVPIVAIDADFHRWNRYLECSGVKIFPPGHILIDSPTDLLILVSNPNHLEEVQGYVGHQLEVRIPSQFVK
jgi:hypothetical protein